MAKTQIPANTKSRIYKTRIRRLAITPDAIIGMAMTYHKGIPRDAKPKSVFYDFHTDAFWIMVSSSEFDEVVEGDVIPELQ